MKFLFSTQQHTNDSRPNIFLLSESLLKFEDDNPHFSNTGKNLLFAYFGLFVLNEILDSGHPRCPISYSKVYFPEIYFGKNGKEMDYEPSVKHSFMYVNKVEQCNSVRYSINNPLKKMNFRSVWFDGETIYGNSKFCIDSMRTFFGGRVKEFDKFDTINYRCFNSECQSHPL